MTDRIIGMLEDGQAKGSWELPWNRHAIHGAPVNAVTGNRYRGVNIVMLWAAGRTTRQWASYKQWQTKGAQVRAGERGTMVVYYNAFDKPTGRKNAEGQDIVERIPILKHSTVFNADQVDGVEAAPAVERPTEVELSATADAFVANTGAAIRDGGTRAYYQPAGDFIGMPPRDLFQATKTSGATEGYYGTLLHELTHWAGHAKRCDRQFGSRFGDNAYAAEELVAELGAAFLCAGLGITPQTRTDHAQYIRGWLTTLRRDKRAIFTAASKASDAADYLTRLQEPVAQAA